MIFRTHVLDLCFLCLTKIYDITSHDLNFCIFCPPIWPVLTPIGLAANYLIINNMRYTPRSKKTRSITKVTDTQRFNGQRQLLVAALR